MTSRLIIMKRRSIELPIQVKTGYKGRFRLEAIRLDGTKRFLAEFDNLITNGGMDMLSGSANPTGLCAVGSGNATPQFTDTSLQTLVASTNNLISATTSAASTSPYYGQTIYTWQFPVGAATGNLSEVGAGPSTSNLFSRALILDSMGSPTTITVLSNEALNVVYTLQQYVPLTDVTGNISLGGTSYPYLIRALAATNAGVWTWDTRFAGPYLNGTFTQQAWGAFASSGVPKAITAGLVLPGAPGDTYTNMSYTSGSYEADIQVQWSINAGNTGSGLNWFQISLGNYGNVATSTQNRGAYQVWISSGPAIPKDNTKVLTLNFSCVWARH